MAPPRPSQKDIEAARKAERQKEMDQAIASGRLVVRQMTPEERAQSDARPAKKPPPGQSRARRGKR
jgi:hypothetical protein